MPAIKPKNNPPKDILPQKIFSLGKKLATHGFKTFLVGGGVRDLFLRKTVSDWDLTTEAKPEEIMALFKDSFYENTFGTVGIKLKAGSKTEEVVEVTTFRKEGRYGDYRHPEDVSFTKNIEEDLERRDFTLNALALDFAEIPTTKEKREKFFDSLLKNIPCQKINIPFEDTLKERKVNLGPGIEGEKGNILNMDFVPELGFGQYPNFEIKKISLGQEVPSKILIDLFGGMKDLEAGLIRTCGDPDVRFKEDALRLIRAVRFATELGFKIEKKTALSICKNAHLIEKVSAERIRDELTKIMLSPWPAEGIVLLQKLGLLQKIMPEISQGIGVSQNRHHIFSVFEHLIFALKFCFSAELEVRLASLFHDVAKPRVKRQLPGKEATFYFHEVESEKTTRRVLERLRFSRQTTEETTKLVGLHMFNFDPALHNETTARRLLHRAGSQERMDKLLIVRIADRLGSGCKKGEVFKLRQLKYLIDKSSSDPFSLKQMKINGQDLMKSLQIKASPVVGDLLKIVLALAIADPKKNKKTILVKLAKEILDREQKNPGTLEEEKKKAKDFLTGQRESHDFKLQSKHKVVSGKKPFILK